MSHVNPQPPAKRRPKWGIIIPAAVALLALLLGGGWFAVNALSTPDYVGQGSGEVLITIREGDTGEKISVLLQDRGVVKSSKTFYSLLLKQDPEPVFQIGTYKLAERMSSQAALDALLDPDNKVELTVTIPEGWFAQDAFERIAETTEIPLADFEEAAKDYVSFGVPAEAPSIEGFLFPATYVFEPEQTARDIIQVMVDRMMQSLDAQGVAVADRLEIVTMASIIQREAGSNPDDFYKVSRVFWNRLDPAIWPRQMLESDATVAYGTGKFHTPWTTPEERADKSNLYNTYANPGLPIGPIGLPGDLAIDAALHPVAGTWVYFVTVNFETGETAFSSTAAEHEAAKARLAEWCVASRARGESYCD